MQSLFSTNIKGVFFSCVIFSELLCTLANRLLTSGLYSLHLFMYCNRAQLLKVLETRKSVLQKEQGMAFARAVAAGFDLDCMPVLMSFAGCFEASRLM